MFTFVILLYCGMTPVDIRPTEVHIALFFTVLMLHLSCLGTARDGIDMMKYALIHHDEFTHPISAFILGFMAFASIMVGESINLVNAQTKKDVAGAITVSLGFKVIIDLPTVYMNSLEDLPIKAAVGAIEQKKKRKDNEREKIEGDYFFNAIYVACVVGYKSLYFYFFPFLVSLIPLLKSLENNL